MMLSVSSGSTSCVLGRGAHPDVVLVARALGPCTIGSWPCAYIEKGRQKASAQLMRMFIVSPWIYLVVLGEC